MDVTVPSRRSLSRFGCFYSDQRSADRAHQVPVPRHRRIERRDDTGNERGAEQETDQQGDASRYDMFFGTFCATHLNGAAIGMRHGELDYFDRLLLARIGNRRAVKAISPG